MNGGLSLAIPCRADEPGLGATLASLYTACQHPALPVEQIEELLVCINGLERETSCASLLAVRDFCARQDIPLHEVWLAARDDNDKRRHSESERRVIESQRLNGQTLRIPVCRVLLTERRGKPPAWNVLWRCASGAAVLFCDADVRVDPEAVWLLYDRLQKSPQLFLVAAREVPVVAGKGTMWNRMGAIPYRFNFGNAGGRLLVIRKGALSDEMPEDLLLEDAWLTVAVGKQRVAKEWQARVYFLPPTSGRDYFAERVRTEGGKLQIRRVHGKLLEDGPIATYRWAHFFQTIALSEYPLVLCAVLVRGVAYLWARFILANKDFYALYRPFRTTKNWSET
jgi:glycosyltransferase involved in cell wall biosynthesis